MTAKNGAMGKRYPNVWSWTEPEETVRLQKCNDDRIHVNGAITTGSFVSSTISPGACTMATKKKNPPNPANHFRLNGSGHGSGRCH